MNVDSAYSDELFKLKATADRLEAEWKAISLQPHASSEEVYAKANEFTEANNAVDAFALPRVTVSD